MKPRKLTNKEMFDLPDWWKDNKLGMDGGWENPKVSIKDYYPSIIVIYEVSQADYQKCKDAGELCQEYQNRFYIA